MIFYSLHRNPLTNGSKSFKAIVQSQGTQDLDKVIDRMNKQGTTVTGTDAVAALRDFFIAAEDLLIEGHRIATPFGILSLSIKGRFDHMNEPFDPERHRVNLLLQPSADFRRKLDSRVELQRKRTNLRLPTLYEYVNPNNGDDNSTLTPGGGAHLLGELLKFDQADPDQGIFLIPAEEAPIRAEVILHNSVSKLTFLVPSDLVAGEYGIEVRALFGKHDIRTGALEETLTVA